jgi:E2F/DP family winged-helix DNA-binding domain
MGAAGLRTTVHELGTVGHYDWDAEDKQKRGESLGVLSRKFVVLFLSSEPGTVMSLEGAAHAMKNLDGSEEEEDEADDGKDSNMAKTKVRRLYDVANIFSALGLVQKKRMTGERKPGFMWNRENPIISGDAEFAFGAELAGVGNNADDDDDDGGGGDDDDGDDDEARNNKKVQDADFDAENQAKSPKAAPKRKKKGSGKRQLFGGDEEATQAFGEMTPFTPTTERGVEDVLLLAQQVVLPFKKQRNLAVLLNTDAADHGIANNAAVADPVPPQLEPQEQQPQQQQLVMVKGEYAYPVAPLSFASPETEKNVASLLMNFSQSSPAPVQAVLAAQQEARE